MDIGITLKDIIGWVVTSGSIVSAALVAKRGWRRNAETALRAQEHRRFLDEEASRKKLRGGLTDGLGAGMVLLKPVIRQLKRPAVVPASLVRQIVVSRERYDRNKDDMVYWLDEKQGQRIERWFRDSSFVLADLDQFTRLPKDDEEGISMQMLLPILIDLLEQLQREGAELYEELGLPAVRSTDPEAGKYYSGDAPSSPGPAP